MFVPKEFSADISSANFSAVDLSGSKFEGVNFRGTRFDYVNAKNVDFSFSDIRGASFNYVDLTGATFNSGYVDDLEDLLDLPYSLSSGASFYRSNITNAVMEFGTEHRHPFQSKENYVVQELGGGLFREFFPSPSENFLPDYICDRAFKAPPNIYPFENMFYIDDKQNLGESFEDFVETSCQAFESGE